MNKLFIIVIFYISCGVVLAEPLRSEKIIADRETKTAVSNGLLEIASCKTNILDCLTKMDLAHDQFTNSLAEFRAVDKSSVTNIANAKTEIGNLRTAGIDAAQAGQDLSSSVKQLAQATRDLLQAIKHINKDNSE